MVGPSLSSLVSIGKTIILANRIYDNSTNNKIDIDVKKLKILGNLGFDRNIHR